MQLLPGCSEENMDRAEEQMQAFVDVASVIEKLGADKIMEKFFGKEAEYTYEYFPEYKCSCSRKKLERVILSLGKEELYKIIEEEGAVKAHCHYCNTDYVFTKDDVDKLF